jgi:hypothetical protein
MRAVVFLEPGFVDARLAEELLRGDARLGNLALLRLERAQPLGDAARGDGILPDALDMGGLCVRNASSYCVFENLPSLWKAGTEWIRSSSISSVTVRLAFCAADASRRCVTSESSSARRDSGRSSTAGSKLPPSTRRSRSC